MLRTGLVEGLSSTNQSLNQKRTTLRQAQCDPSFFKRNLNFTSTMTTLRILSVMFGLVINLDAQPLLPPAHDLKFSYQIEKELAEGTLSATAAAYYYTYIGEYANALQLYELNPEAGWGFDTIALSDPDHWKLVDAIPYLTQMAKDRPLVIISEAHQKPQHRVFTRLLLDSLVKYGFKHLGLEALSNTPGLRDTLLNQRGFALNTPITGTYTREPQMANLIQHAHSLGMQLFAFDRNKSGVERDSQMAQNVIEYMTQHPGEKIILHCGWHHAVESDYPKRRKDHWMAYLIKRKTSVDPLTIYQDILSERYLEPECPIYRQFNSNAISVLVDQSGAPYSGLPGARHVDIQIYHPRTTFIQGRPDWLFSDTRVRNVPMPKEKVTIDYPIICRAMRREEAPDGVPADIIEIRSRYMTKLLALSPGEYILDIYNPAGVRQKVELIVPE